MSGIVKEHIEHDCKPVGGICAICGATVLATSIQPDPPPEGSLLHLTYDPVNHMNGLDVDAESRISEDQNLAANGTRRAATIAAEQAITDHPLLHCIQMAYSAAERTLEGTAVNSKGLPIGLEEIERWLTDALAHANAMRQIDRLKYERTVEKEPV